MKKILIGLFILSSTTLFAQNNRNHQVPASVQNSFQKDYPNSQNPQWNNSNGQWHGTYKDKNNRNVETHYNPNGQRIDTHISYNQNELPSKVRDVANKKYNTNYSSNRIERPNSQPLYQIKSQSGSTTYMDENGKKRKYNDNH
jgi:hypothetical protein